MGFINNITDTLFADVSEFQSPADSSYTDAGYQVLSIRSNDGTHNDLNFGSNYQFCVDSVGSGALAFFICYFYWRPGDTGINTHMQMVNDAGGPHPMMVSMIDLESGGNPDSDQTPNLDSEYNTLASWLGNEDRVIGYANTSDEQTMWQFKPQHLEWILAGYGVNPEDPSLIKLAHQYTDGGGYGGGLPEGAPPWASCDMNSADGLSVAAFAAAVGLTLPGGPVPTQPANTNTPTPPPPAPIDLSGVGDQIFGATPALLAQLGV